MKNQLHIINQIEELNLGFENEKLTEDFITKNQELLEFISANIGVGLRQAALFAIAFRMSFENDTIILGDLAKKAKLEFADMPAFIEDIQLLERSDLLKRQNKSEKASILNNSYLISQQVVRQLLNNGKIQGKRLTFLTFYEVTEHTANLVKFNNNNYQPLSNLLYDFNQLLENNCCNQVVSFINKELTDEVDKLLLCFLCFQVINDNLSICLKDIVDELFDSRSVKYAIMERMFTKNSQLISKNFIELSEDEDIGRTILRLTDKTRALLETSKVKQLSNSRKHKLLYPWKKISSKKLFFNPEENIEVEKLHRILSQRNYQKLRAELSTRDLATGVCILFHGTPGTGKTESVYQLARRLKRDLFVVDISSTKNKYFGDSEKLIKKVFDDYSRIIQKTDRLPILLFNEADAVFSTRKNVFNSSVAHTENSMQNVILQEMESFQGILIATTNSTINFDKAFERRFLLKVKFNQPDTTVLEKIWKAKMPSLKAADIKMLSENFKLTGAQIENVVKNALMDELANSNPQKNKRETIYYYCCKEIECFKTTKPMGFNIKLRA